MRGGGRGQPGGGTHGRGGGDCSTNRCRDQNELVKCHKWPTLTPQLVLQNLEMHDRMEHLIEKQISHGHFSTQTWTKTENLGR